jgi:hypothetical protein
MTATALDRGAPRPDTTRQATPPAPFPAQHPWDRNFFLLWIGLIWFGVAMGFGPEIQKHIANHERPYPLITHVHGFFFMGWLVLATAQILLVRARRTAWHRKLGYAMAAWGGAMIVLGPMVAWMEQHRDFGTPLGDPGFFSIQTIDIISFAVLGTAGVLLRSRPSAHKRLMLIATLCIADAGYGRWLPTPLEHAMGGHTFWPNYLGLFGVTGLMIVGLGVYDLITRRRLHPAYVAGAAWGLTGQLTASVLYFNPAWIGFTTQLFHP